MDLERFYNQTPRLRIYMDLSKHVREVITGPSLFMPAHHPVRPADINHSRLERVLRLAFERQPAD